MERDSFVFYKSFLEAGKDLNDNDRLKYYDRILNFGIHGIDDKTDGIAETLFKLIKPQLEANNKKYNNGKKGKDYGKLGGRPRKNHTGDNIKNPTGDNLENPTGVKKITPNVNDNVNDNVNVNNNVNNNISINKNIINKNKYLDFVELFKNEYDKLIQDFGEKKIKEYIEKLNNYIGSTGKKYKSHYHTILNWIRKEQPKFETPLEEYDYYKTHGKYDELKKRYYSVGKGEEFEQIKNQWITKRLLNQL